MSSTSSAGAVVKLASLHDTQRQQQSAKQKKRRKNYVTLGDSNLPAPNGTVNSIDHSEYCPVAHVPSIYPSTSTEAYDRRQALKNIYTKKSSVPSVANNDDRLSVKPSSSTLLPLRLLERRPPRVPRLNDNGRTPEREQIDNLREELLGVKRNYAIVSKENVALKTRLKRSGNEIVRKERQLQNLLFMQSKGYAGDDHRGNTLALKQKVLMLETLLKEKADEISRLKADRAAMKISDYREQIAALQMECNRLKRYLSYATPPPSKMRIDARSSSKHRGTPSQNENPIKMKKTISLLEEENEKLRSKIQIMLNDSDLSNDDLATMDREQLIGLIIRLKGALKRTEMRKYNRIASSALHRQQDATQINNAQQLATLRRELEKTKEQLRTKSMALEQLQRHTTKNRKKTGNQYPDRGKQVAPKAEIMKIHSDDETEGSLVNAPTTQPSPKITSPIKEVEGTADEAEWENDGGSLSSAPTTPSSVKAVNVAYQQLEDTSTKPGSATEQYQESEVKSTAAEHEQNVLLFQSEHAARTIQKSWRKYKSGGETSQITDDAALTDEEEQPDDTGMNGKSSAQQAIAVAGEDRDLDEEGSEENGEGGSGEAEKEPETERSGNDAELKNGKNEVEEPEREKRMVEEAEMKGHDSDSFESYSLMEGQTGQKRVDRTGSSNTIQKSGLSEELIKVDPSVLLRPILRATSAHLKRLELLATKANFSSSSV